MAFKVTHNEETAASVVAGERLWLTADRERLVPEGHPDAAYLFATEGQPIDSEEAQRYGLTRKARRAR